MAKAQTLKRRGMGKTARVDTWWLQPLAVFLGLSAFIVYSTWAAFQNANYQWGNYLSPMYSPLIFGEGHHSIFGPQPGWWPTWLPFSPAFLILPFPAGFRFTCYYYRGAYYKAFWADPPACAVGEPRKGYTGEHGMPLIVQNIHRYFLYFALLILVFLWYDAIQSFIFIGEDGSRSFGIGIGTLVLTANATLLSFYTLGCHSLRHLVAGRKDCVSKGKLSFACYNCVTGFNKKHMMWAWFSLVMVGFTDFYVRMLASGNWTDFRFL